MTSKVKELLAITFAGIGILLIFLATAVFEWIFSKQVTGIILVLGFVISFASLLYMKNDHSKKK
ncbi:hypothetical protein [Lactococcus cremoris]|uniref:hypothetical protein n=1 Tax=Lactococcus lactis subsp. cremoris TaxID=1359 RepID=UPI0003AB90CA|nr:hypothetical protein [Lactococcus cremoris]AGV72774.1 hypothetical protein kw2_0814 [Lactococcus cremoris subsp. cremoris KW2]